MGGQDPPDVKSPGGKCAEHQDYPGSSATNTREVYTWGRGWGALEKILGEG